MNSKSVYKVPNGKLLKIFLGYDNNKKILDLSITGDFFAYPEESIEIIEKNLINNYLDGKILKNKINNIVRKNKIEFIGLNTDDLVKGILMCLK